jgi:rhodanese-related sulfurtransferase
VNAGEPQPAGDRLSRVFQALGMGAFCFVFAACGPGARPSSDWPELKSEIRRKFPEVKQLTTRELHDWTGNTNRVQPLLLDCRASEEFQVSQLRGAKLFDERFDHENKAVPIVVYCSVGYRSSITAKELRARGFRDVSNLEGSIFEWANAGFPVYQGTNRTTQVHPFDKKWGTLLDKRLHPEE